MPSTDGVPGDNGDPIRTILTAVIRLEGSVAKLATGHETLAAGQKELVAGQKELRDGQKEVRDGQEKLAVRIEQVAGMVLSVDARIDRLAEAFIRHEHPHDHGEAA